MGKIGNAENKAPHGTRREKLKWVVRGGGMGADDANAEWVQCPGRINAGS